MHKRDFKIPKLFDHQDAMNPFEEVAKYQQLLKLGRALDEPAFQDLMESYEIREDGECGSFIFRGIKKAEYEELEKKRRHLKREVEYLKGQLTEEYYQKAKLKDAIKEADSRLLRVEEALVARDRDLK